MASDVPAFLEVGTPVSAKFKGAFCEAAIKQIKKNVKCKVFFKDDCTSLLVNNDDIVGELALNAAVNVRHEDGNLKEGILQKMNDHSLYTVVFDDGDERTLKRTNVCVMGEKHFNEHENLDNLPLTDPENFLTPVLVGTADKRRKRSRPSADVDGEDSDSDKSARRSIDNEKEFLGKVVCIEQGERKKSWFPALGLKNVGNQPENHIYVQSFKDGKKMFIPKEDVKEFQKDKEPLASYFKGELKIEPILRASIDKALAYNDFGELPKGWNILDTIDEKESSDEDSMMLMSSTDPKAFVDMINDFMNRQGITITKPPIINNQAVDLFKLYEFVAESGGSEEVTNQQWRSIYTKLGLQNIHSAAAISMKYLYKRYLGPYETYMKKYGKSSPGRHSRHNMRRAAKKVAKDDFEQTSSVRSESDSESDRRRATRSSKNNGSEKLSEGLQNKKCRSSRTALSESMCEDMSEKNSKEFSEQELDNKSEAEDTDMVNSPRSSLTSEDNDSRVIISDGAQIGKYKPGTRIAVHYGSGQNHRLYNAKILDVEKEKNGEVVYYVHYNGWNHRYDEWIKDERIHGPSSNAPSKRKNGQPPTPLSRIRKDPPKKYQSQIDSDTSLLLLPPNKRSMSEVYVSRVSKHHHPCDKPSSSPRRSPIYISERISDPGKSGMKQSHRPKPVNDTLFIPDIKPSPVKPRLTRNSMQDTFLLNALEESIGKPCAMNLQQDILLKSEPIPLHSRRRPSRQVDPFPKCDNTAESDISSKDDKDSGECNTSSNKNGNTKKNKKKYITTCIPELDSNSYQFDSEPDDKKTLSSFDHPKESSKEETVKKWIEDSNKILSKSNESTEDEVIKKDDENQDLGVQDTSLEDEEPPKLTSETKNCCTKLDGMLLCKSEKMDESNSECDAIKEESVIDVCTNNNENTSSEKEEATESSQMLSDFCNIVESIHKLEANAEVEEELENNTRDETEKQEHEIPTKEHNRSPRKHKKSVGEKSKSKVSQSMHTEDSFKSPKKEKRANSPLEYNVDFLSDLSAVLLNKDAGERIVIMQTKMNAMRTLYCKLRSEVASIDRRRRRKLRKQAEKQRKECT